jgi:hypothetical protein
MMAKVKKYGIIALVSFATVAIANRIPQTEKILRG